jgi:hypothetical protein
MQPLFTPIVILGLGFRAILVYIFGTYIDTRQSGRKLMNRMAKQVLIVTMALMMIAMTSLVWAEEYAVSPAPKEATAEAMLADVFILRPFGLAATVLGSVTFVVALPFTLLSRSVDKAAQRLVVDPAKFTFVRPLGYAPPETGMRDPG